MRRAWGLSAREAWVELPAWETAILLAGARGMFQGDGSDDDDERLPRHDDAFAEVPSGLSKL